MDVLAAIAAVVSLSVPHRANATPTVAADEAFVVVAWAAADAGGATDVFAAVSHDAARTFGTPVRVNSAPGEVRANGEQPPRVVLSRRGSPGAARVITIVWAAKGSRGTKLVAAQSLDSGKSFRPAATLPDTDAAGSRGWHNVAADATGRVFTIWLDHRALARDAAASHREHEAGGHDGVTMAQKSKLYIQSLDGAVVSRAVTQGVCYCCKTALAVDARGVLHAAWRHVYPGNFRDIAYARSGDGGLTFSPPVRISDDNWMLDGCPDDGPALAVDRDGRVHAVWPTLVDGGGEPTIALFYATSTQGAFSQRVQLPTQGVAHHPQITLAGDGSLLAAWDESSPGRRRVVIARAAAEPPRGRSSTADPSFVRHVISDDASAMYPALAESTTVTVVVWTARRGVQSTIAVSRVEID